MSRARRARTTAKQPEPPTFGMQPGQLRRDDIAIEERADPSRPLMPGRIRGARRIGMHDRLADEGLLTRAERAAGTRYAMVAELARLGLSPDPDAVRVWTAHHGRASAAERYVDALEDLLRANDLLGQHGQALVHTLVCEGTDPAIAYRRLWPGAAACSADVARNRVAGALAVHLRALADAWKPRTSEKWD